MSRVIIITCMLIGLAGCGDTRQLPLTYMPKIPKECSEVMDFKVEPLPSGKSTATKLSVDMMKEGGVRKQEHEIAKVCAQYAIQAEATMKDANIESSDSKTGDSWLGKLVNKN